jgi:hypothetical protein
MRLRYIPERNHDPPHSHWCPGSARRCPGLLQLASRRASRRGRRCRPNLRLRPFPQTDIQRDCQWQPVLDEIQVDVTNFEGWTALAFWGEITHRAEIGLLVTGIGYRNQALLTTLRGSRSILEYSVQNPGWVARADNSDHFGRDRWRHGRRHDRSVASRCSQWSVRCRGDRTRSAHVLACHMRRRPKGSAAAY